MKKIALFMSILLLQLVLSSSVLASTSRSMSVSAVLGVSHTSWQDCLEVPSNPTQWIWNDCYHVECEWFSNASISQVITEFAGMNYTASPIGDSKFSTEICNLPVAGNYSWRQYAQDTGGYWGVSDARIYDIAYPCKEGDLTCGTIMQAGVGTGMFLGFLNVPLFNILVISGVAFFVFVFVYYISGVVYKPDEKPYE